MSSSELIKIEALLSEMRPAIQMDGGDIELVSYHEGNCCIAPERRV